MSKVGVLALCLGIGLFPVFGLAADITDHSLEQVLIESATTPEQHEALAKHFRAKAAASRQEAEWHRKMGSTYGGTKISAALAQKKHCEKLSAINDSAAKEYDSLAEEHEALARK